MKARSAGVAVLVAGAFAVSALCVRVLISQQRQHVAAVALDQTSEWFPVAQAAVRLMMERYGPPKVVSPFELRWIGVKPWKRIVVSNEPQSPLEEVVAYHVSAERAEALRRFSHGPYVYVEEGALAARSDRESANRLCLNLADDIVAGRSTPEQADRSFQRLIRLQAAGKSSPYLERLLFQPGNP